MNLRNCTSLAFVLIVTLIAGCGFHLRGEADLPAAMRHVFIDSGDPLDSLTRDLTKAFERAGATVEDHAGEGISNMKITANRLRTDVLSVGGNARANEYQMTYHVEFVVQDAAGKELLPRQVIELSREFTFDSGQSLGIAAEQDVLTDELHRDMVQTIVRRLGALSHRDTGTGG
ncbi:MAG: LPS assembly lipoprotein LptE [Dokdonella sp.]